MVAKLKFVYVVKSFLQCKYLNCDRVCSLFQIIESEEEDTV